MKRSYCKYLAVLCACLCLLLTACSSEGDINTLDQAALQAESESITAQLAQGDAAPMYEKFNKKLRSDLTQQVLETTWQQMAQTQGAFQQVQDCTMELKDGRLWANLLLQYQDGGGLDLKLIYDGNGQIAGIALNYADLPRTPAETDAYAEEAVQVGQHQLSGLLTVPKGVEHPPVVIFIHGSGQSDMDEAVGANNRPFRDLAHGLAQQGIASLRYNKRYFQTTALYDSATVTIQDEVLDDAAAAIALVRSDSRFASSDIIIVGHSMGGMLAPHIAADPEVTAMVSMAGTTRRLEDLIVHQERHSLEQSGQYDADEIDDAMKDLEKEAAKVKDLTEDSASYHLGIGAKYWYSLNQIDTAAQAQQLGKPMLILQGEADWQVYTDVDYAGWQQALADTPDVTFRLYEGLNHLFMDTADYSVTGTVSSRVIDDLAQWIKSLA